MRTFATSPRNLYVSLRTNRPFIGTLNVLKAQLLQALFEEYGAAGADTSRLKPFFQRLAYRHTDTLRSRIYVLSFFFFLLFLFFAFFLRYFWYQTTSEVKNFGARSATSSLAEWNDKQVTDRERAVGFPIKLHWLVKIFERLA